jgi:hypothetical protein
MNTDKHKKIFLFEIKHFTHFLMFILDALQNALFFTENARQMPYYFGQMPAFC